MVTKAVTWPPAYAILTVADAMLEAIHIQNYAVIAELKVEFGPGLNLLSGETGSGKSILVGALGLALGGRASPEVIRTGCDKATVTAVFRSESAPPWTAWLEELGVTSSDEMELIVRREIHASGRTRLLVNDQPVTLTAMKGLAQTLIEVHGQGEQMTLLSPESQLALLDHFAGAEEWLEKVGAAYERRRELERELENLSQDEQARLQAVDLLTFQLQELDRAGLNAGEDARLEEEKTILANLEKIRAAAHAGYNELYEEEGSATARLAAAERALEELARYDSSFEARRTSLDAAKAEVEDAALALRNYLERLNADPHRLDEIETRLALLDRLKRKYGKTIEEVMEYRDKTRRELQKFEHADERRAEIATLLEDAQQAYQRAATELSKRRREAARRLQKLMLAELAPLGMEKTRFEISFEPPSAAAAPAQRERGPRGTDEIVFLISPNPGEDSRPLAKIASGGELSRFMLALRTVAGTSLAGAESPGQPARARTFVFDEVDAGIGGAVAEAVGQRLQRLARNRQVLCVTHLAQIACFADRHFYVEKLERAGRTVTSIKPLEKEEERVRELARMLSGKRMTDDILKHATAMLKSACGR